MLSRSARARPQSVGSVLGGDRVDEEATPPFEPGHPRELGNDLEMPVEGPDLDLAERRRVQHEVEGRVAEHPVHAAEELAERSGQPAQLFLGGVLEGGPVVEGEYPRLEREARRERRQCHEPRGIQDEASAIAALLPEHVAPDAPLLQRVVLRRAGELPNTMIGMMGVAISWECGCSSDASA